MSRHDSWSRLAVEEFFSLCNWQGQPPLMPKQQTALTGASRQTSSWQCFSVQEFFSLCNWQGQPPLMPKQQTALTGANRQTSSWQCFSVQEFFNLCNWQGQPLESRNWHQIHFISYLKAPVREFFQFIPWEGKPEIGSLTKKSTVPAPISATSEPTLTNLSELF